MSRPKLRRLCTSLALSFVLLQSTMAAPPQTAAAGPQAPVLLQKSLASMVGNTSIADVTLTGAARRLAGSDDETGSVTFKALSNGAARFDFSYPSGSRSERRSVLKGQPSGSWSGPDGVAHTISYDNLVNVDSTFPAFALSKFASGQNFVITLIGQETKNERVVYHLSVVQQFPQLSAKLAPSLQRLTQTEIFLDAATLLPFAATFNIHPDSDSLIDIPVELLFSEYNSVNGVQIPFHIQKSLNNSLVLDLQFQSATINSGLSANAFSL